MFNLLMKELSFSMCWVRYISLVLDIMNESYFEDIGVLMLVRN